MGFSLYQVKCLPFCLGKVITRNKRIDHNTTKQHAKVQNLVLSELLNIMTTDHTFLFSYFIVNLKHRPTQIKEKQRPNS